MEEQISSMRAQERTTVLASSVQHILDTHQAEAKRFALLSSSLQTARNEATRRHASRKEHQAHVKSKLSEFAQHELLVPLPELPAGTVPLPAQSFSLVAQVPRQRVIRPRIRQQRNRATWIGGSK